MKQLCGSEATILEITGTETHVKEGSVLAVMILSGDLSFYDSQPSVLPRLHKTHILFCTHIYD
jgi:hypothetical protein